MALTENEVDILRLAIQSRPVDQQIELAKNLRDDDDAARALIADYKAVEIPRMTDALGLANAQAENITARLALLTGDA